MDRIIALDCLPNLQYMGKLQVGEKVVGNANLYYLKCRHDDLCLQPRL
jgi:bacterioferritin (cytochrome b1)